jgi:glutamate 5-kinase
VLVTSGAVGAGMGALGYEKRPGRPRRIAGVRRRRPVAAHGHLRKTVRAHGLHVAQVLLTHDDLEHHERHLNARNTLVTLLGRGVVPIINENDAVSFTEIKFGDNDKLSALVASLLPADLLVILTTVDGVIENFGKANPKTISVIEKIDATIEKLAGGTDSETAVGGMASKIQAAKIAVRSGIPLVIASGKKKNVLAKILAGETKARCSSRSRTNCRAASAGSRFSIIPRARCSWTTARSWPCARRARACCRRAWRAAKANSPPATWCGFAIWTGRNSRAASRSSAPPRCAAGNCAGRSGASG